MKIGIIGNGFVGRATRIFVKNYFSENDDEERYEVLPDTITTPAKPSSIMMYSQFESATPDHPTNPPRERPHFFKRIFFKPIQLYIYDIRPEACYPPGITLEDLDLECDLLFFCLPTPLDHDGTCYTKILEDTIARCSNPYKIIRSTVPVGFSAKHGCYFMPEFLTEARWENDFRSTKEWIVGIPTTGSSTAEDTHIQHDEFKRRISKLIKRSNKNGSIDSSSVIFCDTNEAEMVKLMKNCFLSAKVSLMNEFYDFSRATNVNYNTVVELVKKDARMGTSHFQVPGPDGQRGFGGTCFPKDTHSLYCQMTGHGVTPHIFPAILSRNDTHDRSEREWSKDVWRTTIPLPSATSKIVVVFGDHSESKESESNTDNSVSMYIADVIKSNLSKNNIVIEVIVGQTHHDRRNLHKNHFIKYQPRAGTPIFFPRVDECYYVPQSKQNQPIISYDVLRDVSSIIDLWNCHEEMILYVVKLRSEYHSRELVLVRDRDDNECEESGTEGFDDDSHDDSHDESIHLPYAIDYAKIIEEYYTTKLSHTQRKLIITF
jgi:UDPglucose 6-dehydrogenase